LSIEETKKLRLSLGLKPLEENVKSKAEENYEKHQKELEQKRKREELKERIQKEKKPKAFTGKSLGDGSDLSTEEWAASMKERAKKQQLKIARKKLEELHSEPNEYGAEQLAGLKVGHDLDSLDHETVLVLKDTSVLEDDHADELVNVNIVDKEKTERHFKFKKGKPKYNPYEEFERQQMGLDKRILAQYDDDEEPTGFILSSGGAVNIKEKAQQEIQSQLKKGAISLEYEKLKENDDYYTKEEMLTFRKPKKKKKKSNRRKDIEQVEEDDDGDVSMEVEHEKFSNSNKKAIDSMNFVDDDDLQNALSKVRSATNKKLLGNPTEFALRILEADPEEESMEEHKGLVISDLTEFVAAVGNELDDDDTQQIDVVMEPSKDVPKELAIENHVQEVEMEEEEIREDTAPVILEEEPLVADGLAATLNFLKRKGDLDTVTDEQKQRESLLKERAKWIAEQKLRDIERQKLLDEEKEQLKAQGKKLDKHHLERRQRELERERIHAAEEKFKDYKPTIELVYKDDVGRQLDAKQVNNIHNRLLKSFPTNFMAKKQAKTNWKRNY
jgi:U4/U6.U5 tri-snRNP-associated protein 1